MEELKNSLKAVIKQKVIDRTDAGRMCFGCDNEVEFPHTCNSTMLEKIDTGFYRAWYQYSSRNAFQIEEKLQKAVLIELLADIMPREDAVAKADEMCVCVDWIKTGGGSKHISSTTD